MTKVEAISVFLLVFTVILPIAFMLYEFLGLMTGENDGDDREYDKETERKQNLELQLKSLAIDGGSLGERSVPCYWLTMEDYKK